MPANETNVLLQVDTVTTKAAPVRVTLSVACWPTEVEALPQAGSFVLGNGAHLTYAGHEGKAWLPADALDGIAGARNGEVADWLRLMGLIPVPGPRHATTGKLVVDEMRIGYWKLEDASLADHLDPEPLRAAGAAMRTIFARHVVVSRGNVLVRAPLPVWHAYTGGAGASLGVAPTGSYALGGMNEFAAGRLETAMGFSRRTSGGHFAGIAGQVRSLDPAFQERDDASVIAWRAGANVAFQLRHDLPDMPPDMVRAWHSAAQAETAARQEDGWDRADALRCIVDLMDYGEDPASGCKGRTEGAFWDAHRERVALELAAIRPVATSAVRSAPGP